MFLTSLLAEKISSSYNLSEYQNLQNKSITRKNKTIDKLIKEQTDLIKQIVSNSRSAITEHPTTTTQKEVDKTELKQQKEKESIEDLIRKCQHLSKNAPNEDNEEKGISNSTKKDQITTVEAFGPAIKPQFLENFKLQAKLQNIQPQPKEEINNSSTTIKLSQSEPLTNAQLAADLKEKLDNSATTPLSVLENTTLINGKESLENSFTTQDNYESESKQQSITISEKPQFEEYNRQLQNHLVQLPIQYVQFEPYVLQKIVFSSGKELFYWYKKYPTIPQFLSVAHQQLLEVNQQLATSNNENPTSPTVEVSQQLNTLQLPINQNYNLQTTKIENKPEKIPKYEIEYNTKNKPDNNLYRQEMKFVMSMINPPAPPKNEDSAYTPPKFDAYAYYPKHLQPSTVNVRMPYVPTYHMIKTLSLPGNLKNNNR